MVDLIVYKDRATGIWVIRNRLTGKDIAHESTKLLAMKAKKLLNK